MTNTTDLSRYIYSKGIEAGAETMIRAFFDVLSRDEGNSYTKEEIALFFRSAKSLVYLTLPDGELREELFGKSYLMGVMNGIQESLRVSGDFLNPLIDNRVLLTASEVREAIKKITEALTPMKRDGDSDYDTGWTVGVVMHMDTISDIEELTKEKDIIPAEEIRNILKEIQEYVEERLKSIKK